MPVLTADRVGIRARRGWIVRDVDLRVRAGEVVVLAGAPGSGRTSLLLALADRFRISTGTVRRTGTVALGHVAGVHEPEQALTVAEHVRERLLLLGRPVSQANRVLADEAYLLDPALPGRDLTPYQRHLLGLALARLSDPCIIAVDDIDAGLDAGEQDLLWLALAERAASGSAILATSRGVDPDRPATVYPIGGLW